MTEDEIERTIKSTVHIVMTDPITIMPVDIGSGCIIDFQDKERLLTAAHVTDIEAATCIDTGKPPVNFQTHLYSVGRMSYLSKFDIAKYEDQLKELKKKHEQKEEIDFGQIDLSFATLQHKADFIQNQIDFKEFSVPKGKKLKIKTDLTDIPQTDKEYGFFGRIKPIYLKGTPGADTFETQEVMYGGVKYIQQIGHYYEFELPNPIQEHADFEGTSGAPILDMNGNLVSLVTHGYTGANLIYGIALADFRSGIEKMLLSDDREK